jgi:chromosome segregation ATPase
MSEELYREIAELKAEAKKYRVAKRKIAEELNALKTEHDAILKQVKAPSELKAELEQVKGELRVDRHRAAFTKVATSHKVRSEALDDLWKLSGYNPETDLPDERQITSVVSETIKARPYLVAEPVVEEPKIKPGAELTRGGDGSLSQFVVRKSDMQSYEYMKDHKAELAQASKEGRLKILDE